MRHGDSRASALWGRGDVRWRRIVCVSAVTALCVQASVLADFGWIANWTW